MCSYIIFCLFRLLNMNWFRKQNLIEYCLLFVYESAVARLGYLIYLILYIYIYLISYIGYLQYISYNAYGEFDDPGNR